MADGYKQPSPLFHVHENRLHGHIIGRTSRFWITLLRYLWASGLVLPPTSGTLGRPESLTTRYTVHVHSKSCSELKKKSHPAKRANAPTA